MGGRTVEDRLREEYFALLPWVRRVLEHVEIEALRNRQDFSTFGVENAEAYSLTSLKDLAGVRVLAFPRNRVREIDGILRDVEVFRNWTPDPVLGADDKTVAFKYWGYYGPASTEVVGEYQVMSRLTGRFWEVEHSAMYKTAPTLKDAVEAPRMQEQHRSVLRETAKFEDEFERLLGMDPATDR